MAQVKFYSVSASASKSDANGIYFVTGGELYKGTSRFGANKVWTVPSDANKDNSESFDLESAIAAAGVSGAIGGDILTGYGAAKVFNGSTWVDLGQDKAALDDQLAALVSGLAFSGEGSYITGITQAADGKVSASVSNFADDVKTAVGDGAASSTANGITVSVTTTSGSVTGVQVDATNISAASGTFTDLTVTSTATFSATTVSASTLTVGGSTVEQLADKQIAAIPASTVTSTATGITVGVTTSGGSVTAVSLNAESFANTMHFLGVGTVSKSGSSVSVTPPVGKTPVAGDIVIDSTSGLEAICTSATTGDDPTYTWELIGDNAVYALNAYTSEATVYANVETLPGAVNAAGAAIDALTSKTNAYVGGSASDADQGVSVTVSINATTLAPSVDVVVTSSTLFADLDASVSSSENKGIKVGVTQVNGVVTGVTADLVWLGADGNALT